MKNSHTFAFVALGITSLGAGGCATTPDQTTASAAATAGSDAAYLENMLAGHSAMTGAALEAELRSAAAFPLGSRDNPVRATRAPGQRAYLTRLRCADGSSPSFSRSGSVGYSRYNNIMDVYEVLCADSKPAQTAVFMDMYHPGYVENDAVPGFTIASK